MRYWAGLLAVAALFALAPPAEAADEVELWAALRGGNHVALMRHALAPGTGDPADFDLADCSTQRNLSAEGQAQARAIGDRFRANGLDGIAVYSSQWCRCLDTAREMGVGEVTPLPLANSVHGRPDAREPQTAALSRWIAAADLARPVLIVTHQSNIAALTGRSTGSGDIVVVRRTPEGAVVVAGAIMPP